MRKIGLILILTMGAFCAYAKTQTTAAKQKNTYIVLSPNKAEMDKMPNTVNMDSAQIALFNCFLNDSVLYYKTDSILRSELDSLRGKVSGIQAKAENGEYGGTKLWVRIMLFSLAFLLAVCVFYVILRLKGLRDEVVDVVKGSGRIKEWLQDNFSKSSTSMVSKSYDSEIRSLQNENRDLKNRVAALEDTLRKNVAPGVESPVVANQQISSKPVETQKLLYADSIIDGMFSHVKEQENDDTIFVLKLKNANSATISIFKQAYGRVLANASYLEGCEKQIIGNSSVEIVREGEAERAFNGKWKVVSPLKVEIR